MMVPGAETAKNLAIQGTKSIAWAKTGSVRRDGITPVNPAL
jgi:hypothetical protein